MPGDSCSPLISVRGLPAAVLEHIAKFLVSRRPLGINCPRLLVRLSPDAHKLGLQDWPNSLVGLVVELQTLSEQLHDEVNPVTENISHCRHIPESHGIWCIGIVELL